VNGLFHWHWLFSETDSAYRYKTRIIGYGKHFIRAWPQFLMFKVPGGVITSHLVEGAFKNI